VIAVWISSLQHKTSAALLKSEAKGDEDGEVELHSVGTTTTKTGKAAAGRSGPSGPSGRPSSSSPSSDPYGPRWELPHIVGPSEGTWVFHGTTTHTTHTVIQDNAENGADVGHLGPLHGPFSLPWLRGALEYEWGGRWHAVLPGEESEPLPSDIVDEDPDFPEPVRHRSSAIALLTIKERMRVAGTSFYLPGTNVSVAILQCGPGVVLLRMHLSIGVCLVIETVIPLAPMKIMVRHALYAPPSFPRIAARLVLRVVGEQYERDAPILSAKQYQPRPVLVKGDLFIPTYRRWTQQFVQPGAITFREAVLRHRNNNLDW
jgi:hypothetical protein